MESWEALDRCIDKKTQAVAKRLGVSKELVYRWQQSVHDYSQSGAYNPLDRIEAIVSEMQEQGAGDEALLPLSYLAERFNVVLVPLPAVKHLDSAASQSLLRSVAEFGELASVAADAVADGRISREERSDVLREGWQAVEALVAFLRTVEAACPVKGRV
ncbi:MAG: hypothetical protein J7K75_08600 [Desulfuromonas sp.]|nr:hypothetical protein [Desulfuromonas sp.]